MLTEAARTEGISISEMTEKAIRLTCIDYMQHNLEITQLDNGAATVRLSCGDREFYSRRGVPRHFGEGVRAVVEIKMAGPVVKVRIAQSLRHIVIQPVPKHLKFISNGISVQVKDATVANTEPAGLKNLFHFAAQIVESLDVTSMREIIRQRCPTCSSFMTHLAVWAAQQGGPEEREWQCSIGHTHTLSGPAT